MQQPGTEPGVHERGVRAAWGVQHHQAGQRDEGALPGGLRGPDQPDIHLHEHSSQRVSITEHKTKLLLVLSILLFQCDACSEA